MHRRRAVVAMLSAVAAIAALISLWQWIGSGTEARNESSAEPALAADSYRSAPDARAGRVITIAVASDTASRLVYTDAYGSPTVVQVPVGAVTETLVLAYTPVATVTTPPGFSFAGHAFELEAQRDGGLVPGFVFEKPVTVTVHYTVTDVSGLDEGRLELRYWEDSVWRDAATTCGTASHYTRSAEQDWFALPICQLGRFAAFDNGTSLLAYLPLLLTPSKEPEPPPTPSRFARWRAVDGGFADWELDGVRLAADGDLELDPASATGGNDPYGPGGYCGRDFYNGGSFLVGEALSPVALVPLTVTQAIASWNTDTPPGTWIETQVRAQLGGRWTKWYIMGVWAADGSTVERHSVALQGDADAYVAVDTLVLLNETDPLSAYQLKVRLFSVDGSAVPTVRNVSLAASEPPATPDALEPGVPTRWDRVLQVPECSQMVYPEGGPVWCSPTSTAMVLAYWSDSSGPCEPRVRDAVAGVYDWLYDGHGNWPFNTAYAATFSIDGYVARLTSLAQAEEWIGAGVPVITSLAWGSGELDGAPLAWSNGHLMVLVGFDADGDPILNDPAASTDAAVQRTYIREQFESLWLKHTSGTVYLIYPPDWTVPDL